MPEWEKGRYISLLGDPIGRDGKPESALKSSFKNADGQALGLTSVLGVLSMIELINGDGSIDPFSGTVLGALNLGIRRKRETEFLKKNFGDAAITTKCIDTRPDSNTIPTLEKNGVGVLKTSKDYTSNVVSRTVMYPVFFSLVAPFSSDPRMLAITAITMLSGEFARDFSGIRRFNKVLSGDHVIVDMPKPKPVEEKVEALSFAGMQA